MNMKKKVLLVSVFVLALGGVVFAQGYYGYGHMGDGYGHRGGRGNYGRNNGGGYYGNGCGGYGAGYGHMGYGYGHRGGRGGYGYNNYRYTPEDYATIDAIYQKYYADIEKIRADLYAKDSSIRAEMYQQNPDQKKIDTLIDETTKLRADMQKLMTKIDNEIRTALKK